MRTDQVQSQYPFARSALYSRSLLILTMSLLAVYPESAEESLSNVLI